MSKRAVEDIYKKQTQHEHVLSRPDTYIGSAELEKDTLWVLDSDSSSLRFVQKELTYSPALYRIADELINNAQDNKIRDPSMSEFRMDINREQGSISIYNNGKSIPITIHKEYNVYVAEMIFGQLLTSSNYDDEEKRVTGGRNGYGAKLTNIFSTEFIVETCDEDRGLKYVQVFRDNMFVRTEPVITKCNGASYTRITFKPDFKRFHMSGLDDDIVALLTRRVYDVAGTSAKGLKVFLNNKRIAITNFKQYCELYFPPAENEKSVRIHEQINDRWEVVIAPSDGNFQQVSFVNGINTLKGGTHVLAITDQVVKTIIEGLSKKNKKISIKPQFVKSHMFVMINTLIENPAFDTQTKMTLTTKRSAFGSDPSLSELGLKRVMKSGICDSVQQYAQFKQDKDMKKNDGKKTSRTVVGIPKLEDANEAGGKRAKDCTLILTEGDSAKALAMSGLSVVGRDLFGVFPLRGKQLNVREATGHQIMENKEIGYLKQILGLKAGTKYKDVSSLRYGHVMIMTDQDYDGSHIKGLIINMFDTFWPDLLKVDGFLTEFITPIVKVTRGHKELPFYTLPQFQNWQDANNGGSGWKSKYYKGLGTSTAAEAKVYFSNIDTHQVPFEYIDQHDNEKIELAFSRTAVNKRKEWLALYKPGTFLDHAQSAIAYRDFIDKELILYSIAANQRAIPCVVDGLKPGQRKVMFACFKRNLQNELKVAQLSGYVAEQSAYHHGEVSLALTIVNLAQNYVGANNINVLWPAGQFGTRAQGGKDHASARYIFTHLSPVTRAIFKKQDEDVLTYLTDDGMSIEPEFYAPVIPMVLVNGSAGIGMGWSSEIPNYNPREIIANLRAKLRGEELTQMHPWYKGFVGKCLIKGNSGSYAFHGICDVVEENTVHIYELPIGTWTSDYKQFLEELVVKGQVKEMAEYHTDVSVAFTIVMSPEGMSAAESVGLSKFFKLESSVSTTNMVLFDREGKLKKYDTPLQILEEFYEVRLEYYEKRKTFMQNQLNKDLDIINAKVRFIQAVIKEEIKIRNIKRADIVSQLASMKFPQHVPKSKKKDVQEDNEENSSGSEEDSDDKVKVQSKGYDYLLGLPLWSLTWERVQALLKERDEKDDLLSVLMKTSIEQMWLADLDDVETALETHEAKEIDLMNAAERAKVGNKARKVAGKKSKDSDDEWASTSKARKGKAKAVATYIPDWVNNNEYKIQSYDYVEEVVKKKRTKELSVKEEEDLLNAMMSGNVGDLMKKPVKREGAKKPRSKAKVEVMDDDDEKFVEESESELSEEVFLEETPVKKRSVKKVILDSESEVTPVKAKPRVRKPILEDEEEDYAPKKPAARGKKLASMDDDEEDFESKKPAPAKRAAAKKAAVKVESDDEDFEPKKPAKKAATKKAAVKMETDDEDYSSPKKPAARGKKAATVVKAEEAVVAPVKKEATPDLSNLSLRERMALKMKAKSAESDDLNTVFAEKLTITPVKKPQAKRKTKADLIGTPLSPPRKKASKSLHMDDEESDEVIQPGVVMGKPRRAAAKATLYKDVSDDEQETDLFDKFDDYSESD